MKRRFTAVLLALLMVIGSNLYIPADVIMQNTSELTQKTAAEKQAVINQINAAQPGDTIIVPNGIYDNFEFNARTVATEANPVIIRAETPGSVILTGLSRITISGRWITIDGFYFKGAQGVNHNLAQAVAFSSTSRNCTLKRTAIVDWNPTDRTRDTRWVRVTGYNHLIDQCYIRGKNTPGMKLEFVRGGSADNQPAGNENHTVTRTYFGQFADGGGNGYETVRVGLSATSLTGRANITMEYNYFYQCDGENEIISNKSCNNTYRYNTFYNSIGELTLRHGNDCLVEGNVFYDTNGSRMIGERHQMRGNYFGNTRSNGLQINNGLVSPELSQYYAAIDSVIIGNTFYSSVSAPSRHVALGVGSSATRPVSASGVFNSNVMVTTASSGNFFAVSDASIINDRKMTFSGNYAFGRNLGTTNAAAVAGFNTTNPQMVRHAMNGPFDLFAPSASGVNAGMRIADLKAPMTPVEILPDWMLEAIYANEPGFTFPDNMKPAKTTISDLARGATRTIPMDGSTNIPRVDVTGSNNASSGTPVENLFDPAVGHAQWSSSSVVGEVTDGGRTWFILDYSGTTKGNVTFDRIVLGGRTGQAQTEKYTIEVSHDKVNWTKIVRAENTTALTAERTHDFPTTITTKYIRFVFVETSDTQTPERFNVRLGSFEVYYTGNSTPPAAVYGDVNGDGVINAADVTMLRVYLSGVAVPSMVLANADVNGDGVINNEDVVLLRRWLAATDPSSVNLGS